MAAEKFRADMGSQMPALSTARSMGPSVPAMLRAACAIAAGSVTSSGSGAMPGCARASSASLSAERAEAATLTPCRTSATASARPMPVLAPVIQAVRQRAAMRSVIQGSRGGIGRRRKRRYRR